MKYINFQRAFSDMPMVSIHDLRRVEPAFDRRRLTEWQQKGYISKLMRGFYYFTQTPVDEHVLGFMANKLYSPSYVSMQSALAWHGLIPEATYGITSVTTRKTAGFRTPLGQFSYGHVKPELWFGYQVDRSGSVPVLIAEPEKAILDYLYLNPSLRSLEDMREIRLNPIIFEQKMRKRMFEALVGRMGGNLLRRQAKQLWSTYA